MIKYGKRTEVWRLLWDFIRANCQRMKHELAKRDCELLEYHREKGWMGGSWQSELPVMCEPWLPSIKRPPCSLTHTISQLTTETNQAQPRALKMCVQICASLFLRGYVVFGARGSCVQHFLEKYTVWHWSSVTVEHTLWPIESKYRVALINCNLPSCIFTYANLLRASLKILVVTDLISAGHFRRMKWIFMPFLAMWSLVDIKALRPFLFAILFLKVH